MVQLFIHSVGTNDTALSHHETVADAHHALARFARGKDIQGYGTTSGTITVPTHTGVNQASHVWNIR